MNSFGERIRKVAAIMLFRECVYVMKSFKQTILCCLQALILERLALCLGNSSIGRACPKRRFPRENEGEKKGKER